MPPEDTYDMTKWLAGVRAQGANRITVFLVEYIVPHNRRLGRPVFDTLLDKENEAIVAEIGAAVRGPKHTHAIEASGPQRKNLDEPFSRFLFRPWL